MGLSALIIGSSGSGKSTSIGKIEEINSTGLNPEETIILSSLGKELPWPGSGEDYSIYDKEKNPKGNMIITSRPAQVLQWLHYINEKRSDIKNVVLEDNTHNSSMEYMRRINEKTFDKFNDIADFMSKTAIDVKTFRDDLTVFFLHHTREVGDGILEEKHTNAMTIGKLVDEKLSGYESFFTIVLRAIKKVEGDEVIYRFLTKDPHSTVKTPIGMFEQKEIPNDLGFVKETMVCYYDKTKCKTEVKERPIKK